MSVEVFNSSLEIKNLAPITLTPAAVAYVRKQIKQHDKGIGFRLRIKTNGCSGKAYKPEIAESLEDNEITFSVANDVFIIVSKNDFILYLTGLVIDYQRQGLNAALKYLNPNEKGACGCGESFTT